MIRDPDAFDLVVWKVANGIIDRALLQFIGADNPHKRGSKAWTARIVRDLFLLGMHVEAIEDWFELDTKDVKRMTRDIKAETTECLRRAGMLIREINRRLLIDLSYIHKGTRRYKDRRNVMKQKLSKEKIDLIQKLYLEGVIVREIARQAGCTTGTVSRYTEELPRRLVRKSAPVSAPTSESPNAA